MQIVVAHTPHSYARCFQFRLRLKALMINDGMRTLCIIINLVDLHCLLIICLTEVKLSLESDVTSIFANKTATINSVAVAEFFNIIWKAVLLSLFISEYCNGSLLGPVSTYFRTVKTNDHDMLSLHCLV